MQDGSGSAGEPVNQRRRNSDDKNLILGKYRSLAEVPREVTITLLSRVIRNTNGFAIFSDIFVKDSVKYTKTPEFFSRVFRTSGLKLAASRGIGLKIIHRKYLHQKIHKKYNLQVGLSREEHARWLKKELRHNPWKYKGSKYFSVLF